MMMLIKENWQNLTIMIMRIDGYDGKDNIYRSDALVIMILIMNGKDGKRWQYDDDENVNNDDDDDG